MFQVVLFLLLGAVVNVAITWWVWWIIDYSVITEGEVISYRMPINDADCERWKRHARGTWQGKPPVTCSEFRQFGLRSRVFGKIRYTGREVSLKIWRIDFGWPFRWLRIESSRESVRLNYWWIIADLPVKHTGWIVGSYAVPRQIMWRGFVGNTVLCAACLCLTPLVPRGVRRWFRIRRGHCPGCAYDLRGNPGDGCPECGWRREADA